MELETARLLLRPWQSSDAKDLFEAAKDAEVGLRCGWQPHQSVEESEEIIKNVLSHPYDFAIVLKDGGKVIGSISLMESRIALPANQSDKRAMEVGFWLGRPYWKQQYMTEALAGILDLAFEELDLDAITCGHADFNEGSRAIQQKAGFERLRITENSPVPLLNTTWTLIENWLPEEKWQAMRSLA